MSNQSERIAGLTPEKRELLLQLLKKKDGSGARRQIEPQKRDGGTFPLSFAQQRLWFLNQLQPDSPFYNVPDTYRIEGRLNAGALERSFDEIVRRHEVLRTTFSTSDGEPRQVIHEPTTFSLPVVSLEHLPPDAREAEAMRLAEEEANRLFDLTRDTMLRARLLRLDEELHVLLMSMHHIASDGWSRGVLVNELMALYEAFSAGKPSPLPPLDIQYADFSVWQREWLSGEVLEQQLAYWKERLDDDLPPLELPTDRPRPAASSYRGKFFNLELKPNLERELNALSRVEGVTLFMTLLAAFKTLLYRYTGQADIIVGTPIAGRNRREIEGLIGYFVNTLVLRTSFSGSTTFRQLLGLVKQTTVGAYAHQDLPFEKLVEELQPHRNLNRNPIFQVAFALQNAPMKDFVLHGLKMSALDIGHDTARFDMEFYLWETGAGLSGYISYSTDLFDESTIARMVAHYERLLEEIVANPDREVSQLSLLTAQEQEQLALWNQTTTVFEHACLHRLFVSQVEKTPDAVALVYGDKSLTYRELDVRAKRLARYLQRLHVGPESLVGIMVERSIEMVVGILGVLEAGGAYVPLDPVYPPERLSFMLEDAAVQVLLTQEHLNGRLLKHEAQVVYLGAGGETCWHAGTKHREVAPPLAASDPNPAEEDAGIGEKNVANGLTPQNLAYVIYTSGSTGRPKGVAITHGSASVLCAWARSLYSSDELRFVLASTSICFDLSIFELFVPLSCGGAVVLVENALALTSFDDARQVTLINTVPSAMTELLRLGGVPASVRTINLAGEPLKKSLVQQIYSETAASKVWNLYGPSEDTTYSTYALATRDAPHEPRIGHPLANTRAYVLDAQMQPAPIGVAGELYLGGDGLARGYLRQPALTAERFVPDPFSREGGTRLYRTGDLARRLPDGELEFFGRVDNQVKVRGYRIELGEVEAVLNRHPSVSGSVVIAREDEPGEKRLVAYFVKGASDVRVSELRNHLLKHLPEYMLPSAFVALEALPLTPNGKIDRRALPAPTQSGDVVTKEFVAPRSELEEKIAKSWRDILRLESVGIHDDFFELGGHSLLATRIISRLREKCAVDVPLRVMFETPTVSRLAEYIEQQQPQQKEIEQLVQMLDKLENLSKEEVQELLKATGGNLT